MPLRGMSAVGTPPSPGGGARPWGVELDDETMALCTCVRVWAASARAAAVGAPDGHAGQAMLVASQAHFAAAARAAAEDGDGRVMLTFHSLQVKEL
eukprot:gene38337-3966_t